MANSVLLDTTFLISLVDDKREHHLKAKEFYKHFLDNKFAMILSAIATCEFCIKQPLTDLPLHNFKMLSFNIPDSHHLSKIYEEYFKGKSTERVSVKDDFKLISQASFNNIDFLITEDWDLVDKYMRPLIERSLIKTKHLFSPNGLNKEFNIASPSPTLFPVEKNESK